MRTSFLSFFAVVIALSLLVNTVQAGSTLIAGPITPVNPMIDKGQTVNLNANASGGMMPYTYQWYNDSNCSTPIKGATASSYSATPSGKTTYTYEVTDATKVSTCSVGDIVTVNSALAPPSANSSASTIYQGEWSNLTSGLVITGTSPYAYQWLQEPPGADSFSRITGATSSDHIFLTNITTTEGKWSFKLQVTDSSVMPEPVTTAAVNVTVNSTPIVTTTTKTITSVSNTTSTATVTTMVTSVVVSETTQTIASTMVGLGSLTSTLTNNQDSLENLIYVEIAVAIVVLALSAIGIVIALRRKPTKSGGDEFEVMG